MCPNVWSEPERVDPKCGPKMWTQMWFESVRRFPVDPNLAATHPSLYLWGRIGSTQLGPIWVRVWVRIIWVRSRIPDIPDMATDRYNEAGTDWQRQQWRSQSFELAVHGKKINWAENDLGRSHNWDARDGEY